MTIVLRESFLRTSRGLSAEERSALMQILVDLRATLSDPARHAGLGLRKLNPHPGWEVRLGLKTRALFRQEDDQIIFMFAGSHDEVVRFLRNFR